MQDAWRNASCLFYCAAPCGSWFFDMENAQNRANNEAQKWGPFGDPISVPVTKKEGFGPPRGSRPASAPLRQRTGAVGADEARVACRQRVQLPLDEQYSVEWTPRRLRLRDRAQRGAGAPCGAGRVRRRSRPVNAPWKHRIGASGAKTSASGLRATDLRPNSMRESRAPITMRRHVGMLPAFR
jgi:hypothetical protein